MILKYESMKIYAESLERDIEKLKAKVKRLQQSKLDKAAMMAMQGLLQNSESWDIPEDKIAEYAIKQAKSLLAALEHDGKGDDE